MPPKGLITEDGALLMPPEGETSVDTRKLDESTYDTDAAAAVGSAEVAIVGNPVLRPEGSDVSAKSSVWGAASNFVNSIIGAGIIGLPFAMREAGLGAGVLLLIAIAFMTSFSVQLIVSMGLRVSVRDYEALCQHAFGPAGFVVITTAMFLFASGAMCAYLVILADTLTVSEPAACVLHAVLRKLYSL